MMTTEEKTLLVVLMLATVLVPVALGAALGWPVWSWLLLAVPLLAVLWLVARNVQRRVQQDLLWPSHAALRGHVEQQDQAPHTPVADVTLPSADPDYHFRFSATACWRPARGSRLQHTNPGALAADTIVERARTITAAEQPDQVGIVQHRLASALGAVQLDASGGVETWADQVQLTLSEADQEQLRKRSDKRKDNDLWEHEREHECRKRAYLSNDVLKSTGSAVTWWLARKDNDVEDTVRLLGALTVLCAAANNTEVPEPFRHLVPTAAAPGQLPFASPNGDQRLSWAGRAAGSFSDVSPVAVQWEAMMDTLDLGDGRALFSRRIAQLLDKFAKPHEAQEIRRYFDAPATGKDPADLPEPGGDLPGRPAPDVQPPRQGEPWRDSAPPGESEQSQADE